MPRQAGNRKKGNERHEKIKKKTPEFFVEKGFDFNYAISTVKSQGSTYDNVYYDASIKTQEYKTKVMNDEKEIGSVISSRFRSFEMSPLVFFGQAGLADYSDRKSVV